VNKTKIEWADSTWSPVTGCYHNCEYCYARRIAERFGAGWETANGGLPVLDEPARGMRCGKIRSSVEPYPYKFTPTFHRYKLDEPQHWKKPRTIFVCSMADLFGEWVPDEWIEAVFAACKKAPQHRYLFLTKNPQRYINLAKAGKLPEGENMWYGTTVTTPDMPFFWGDGWNTFVSIEPIQADFGKAGKHINKGHTQWVIVGAETGNRKEKTVPKKEWIDGIIHTCKEAGSPLFMKDSLSSIMGEENMIREFPWK